MKQIKFILTAIIAVLLFTNNVKAQTSKGDSIVGNWYTENKDFTIEIYTIDVLHKYYGRVTGFKGITDKSEMTKKIDVNNPNAMLKQMPLMGKIIMDDFSFNDKNQWDGGTIYDPKTGQTYSCTLSLENKNKIKIQLSGVEKPIYWTKKK